VLLAAALVIFSYTYLHLGRWHVRYLHLTIGWLVGLVIVLGIASFSRLLSELEKWEKRQVSR